MRLRSPETFVAVRSCPALPRYEGFAALPVPHLSLRTFSYRTVIRGGEPFCIRNLSSGAARRLSALQSPNAGFLTVATAANRIVTPASWECNLPKLAWD